MTDQVICPIWGTPAARSLDDDSPDAQAVFSARTGGKYRITGTARAILDAKKMSAAQRVSLTSWLVAQRKAGITVPTITSTNLDAAISRSQLSFSDRVDVTLQFLQKIRPRLDQQFVFSPTQNPDNETQTFMAETETEVPAELRSLLVTVHKMGLLEANLSGPAGLFWISASGWQRLDTLRARSGATPQAFVAMWFHPTTQEAYEKGIVRAIEDSGYRPIRIDQKEHINKIDDEIIAEIRRSHFVVADFTCEPGKVCGGVYFEAGFAMGLRIPVIWTCRDGTSDLHFDTRQYAHLIWTTPDDLRGQLRARIGAVIGQGPLKPA